MSVAEYFDLDMVGRATATWRSEAAQIGLTPTEIVRVAPAFEHEDLRAARAL